MEEIVKNFLEEVDDIEKSSLFVEVDCDEPTTEWVEEIDPRTNFPFYWNSKTKESVWDKPDSYEEYLVEYERYLKNVMDIQCIERAREQHEDNMKKRSDMRGLLGYSDSEDENPKDDVVKEDIEVIEETKVSEEIKVSEECQPEESVAIKKERWMIEQITLAKQYLHNLVKVKSETALKKIEQLPKNLPNNETLIPIGLRIQTRLEDWEGGHLTLERTVEKLQEALISLSKLEGDLESTNWRLQWDNDTMRYYSVNTVTGKKKLTFPCNGANYEDGEIVDDDDDLTSDLHEYVISTLHRSLQDNAKSDCEESIKDASNVEGGPDNKEVPEISVQEDVIKDNDSPLCIVDKGGEVVNDRNIGEEGMEIKEGDAVDNIEVLVIGDDVTDNIGGIIEDVIEGERSEDEGEIINGGIGETEDKDGGVRIIEVEEGLLMADRTMDVVEDSGDIGGLVIGDDVGKTEYPPAIVDDLTVDMDEPTDGVQHTDVSGDLVTETSGGSIVELQGSESTGENDPELPPGSKDEGMETLSEKCSSDHGKLQPLVDYLEDDMSEEEESGE